MSSFEGAGIETNEFDDVKNKAKRMNFISSETKHKRERESTKMNYSRPLISEEFDFQSIIPVQFL